MQVYDQDDKLRLNDVVDFVGVLSFAPELATLAMDAAHAGHDTHAGELDPEATRHVSLFEEEMAARPPTSQVRA